MLSYIQTLSRKLGIDGAIAYTVLSRCIQAGGGLVSIIFIAKHLTKIEQGYYYTFGSILAIQIFFELGLSNIITQYVAHEMAHLTWNGKSDIQGDEASMSRLSSLLHFCIKWFGIMAIILVAILIIAGNVFFNTYNHGDTYVNWQSPWIILCISTAGSLMISPILSFFEGLSKVKEVAMMRLVQQVFQLTLLYIFLSLGLKLFSSPLAAIITFFIVPAWVLVSYKFVLLKNIWNKLTFYKVNYRLEIFPLQWKIALSWISGFFIFQLFNPVLFATEGPIVAGQMGMTLAALNGVMSISMSWINTKVPVFSNLIALKDFKELDRVFAVVVRQSSLICGAALVFLLLIVFILKYFELQIGNRFLPFFPLILLCTATFVNQLISALATYLRCHKEEPFLVQSIVMGLLTAASTFILGHAFGLNGIVIGYSALVIIGSLIWSLLIFYKKRELWHT